MLYDKFRSSLSDSIKRLRSGMMLKLLQSVAYNSLGWTEMSGRPGHRTSGDKQLRYQYQQGAERERDLYRERERERPGQTAGRSGRDKRWSDD